MEIIFQRFTANCPPGRSCLVGRPTGSDPSGREVDADLDPRDESGGETGAIRPSVREKLPVKRVIQEPISAVSAWGRVRPARVDTIRLRLAVILFDASMGCSRRM